MRGFFALAIAGALTACAPSAEQSAIENNADMMADNMEMMADNLEAMADAAAPPTASEEPSSAWSYTELEDKMRGGKNKRASVDAVEPIRLPFPYGESTPSLNIRQDKKYGFDIFLTANGQFLCRSYDDDTLSVKFDDGPIREWACAEPDGGSSDTVFINRAESFLSALRKANEVTIEAPMYEAGRQQMTFKVARLKW